MANIIMAILKILGIILLCLLGIVIFMIVTILFIPFRYSVDATKDEGQGFKECVAKGKVTWMLFLLRCQYTFDKGESKLSIRFLGLDVQKIIEFKNRISKKKKNNKSKENIKKKADKPARKNVTSNQIKKVQDDLKKVPVNSDGEFNVAHDKDILENKESKLNKIKKKISGFKEKIINVKKKIKDIFEKVIYYKDEISKEENRAALRFIWGKVKEVLNHVKPRKLKGNITFGLDGPDKTGQVLGILAIFYPVYGNNFNIKPDFTTKCLYGDIVAKGRIRIFTLLVICIKLIRSNEYKKIYNIIKK